MSSIENMLDSLGVVDQGKREQYQRVPEYVKKLYEVICTDLIPTNVRERRPPLTDVPYWNKRKNSVLFGLQNLIIGKIGGKNQEVRGDSNLAIFCENELWPLIRSRLRESLPDEDYMKKSTLKRTFNRITNFTYTMKWNGKRSLTLPHLGSKYWWIMKFNVKGTRYRATVYSLMLKYHFVQESLKVNGIGRSWSTP